MNLSSKALADYEALARALVLPDGTRPLVETSRLGLPYVIPRPYVREEVEAALAMAGWETSGRHIRLTLQTYLEITVRSSTGINDTVLEVAYTNPAAIAGAFLVAARGAVTTPREDVR